MKVSLTPGLWKRALALTLAALLPTQSVLASLAESDIWKERREAIEKSHPENQPTQVASLSASFQNPQSILKQLPSVGAALPQVPRWSPSTNAQGKRNSSKKYHSALQTLLDSIPLIYGTVQEVYDSGNEKISPVVLIQDIHLNSEAQTNISA